MDPKAQTMRGLSGEYCSESKGKTPGRHWTVCIGIQTAKQSVRYDWERRITYIRKALQHDTTLSQREQQRPRRHTHTKKKREHTRENPPGQRTMVNTHVRGTACCTSPGRHRNVSSQATTYLSQATKKTHRLPHGFQTRAEPPTEEVDPQQGPAQGRVGDAPPRKLLGISRFQQSQLLPVPDKVQKRQPRRQMS